MTSFSRPLFLFVVLGACANAQLPQHAWIFTPETVAAGAAVNQAGELPARLPAGSRLEPVGKTHALVLGGGGGALVTRNLAELKLPASSITVDAWVRVDEATPWGGFFSAIQDNGAAETGVLLGFTGPHFAFALASKGADDGDGKLTYVKSRQPFVPGGWYHVVGTYDGGTMRLYVNGKLAGLSGEQNGAILYPAKTVVELGAYRDDDEHHRMKGRLHSVRVWNVALGEKRVQQIHAAESGKLPKSPTPVKLNDEDLAGPIARGVRWLLRLQEVDGSWTGPQYQKYRSFTALVVYTMLKCGLSKGHPAVRAGISFMMRQEYTRTYDRGVALMAFEALHDPSLKPRMKALARALVRSSEGRKENRPHTWGYPGTHGDPNRDHWDLSNTQYALLGLRAAHRAGVEVGSKRFWNETVKSLIDNQDAYGGFGYAGPKSPTSSMTTAGVGSLMICREILGADVDKATAGRLRAGITRGLQWLIKHWSVANSVNAEMKSGGWHLYYLYGLERVGAFGDLDLIGKHDWHQEGARVIVKRQRGDGSWNNSDSDTCFALLFLRRGSRTTGLGPRARQRTSIAKGLAFAVGSNNANPVVVATRRIDPALRKRLDAAGGKVTLEWTLNGKVVQTCKGFDAEGLYGKTCWFERRFDANGSHKLRGSLLIADGGKPVLSNIVDVHIDDVEEAWHSQALTDHESNLMSAAAPVATASSGTGMGAVDARYSSAWWCQPEDRSPWLDITLGQPVKASALKLTGAVHSDRPKFAARPREVVVIINGGDPITVRLPDDARRKHLISFPSARVKTIRFVFRSVWPGTKERTRIGLKEVELHFIRSTGRRPVAGAIKPLSTVVERAADGVEEWLYSTGAPGAGWNTEGFKPRGWRRRKSGFGQAVAGDVRTEWKTKTIRLRKNVRIPARISALLVDVCHPGPVKVWINGARVGELKGGSGGRYRSLTVTGDARAAVRPGKNLIAVEAHAGEGRTFLDVTLLYRK